MVNPILLPELREMIRNNQKAELTSFCTTLHPATAAEFMEGLTVEESWSTLSHAPLQRQAEIFEFFPLSKQIVMTSGVESTRMARLLEAMSPDERVDLLERVEGEIVESLLPLVAQAERTDIIRLLSFPPESAGSVMTTEYASLTETLTAEKALTALRNQAPHRETIYYIYVLDSERHLRGVVSLAELVVASKTSSVSEIMTRDVISVRVEEDQEVVARKLARYDFIAIPVVDDIGKLVGIVTHDDIIDVVIEEADEDVMQLGGVLPFEEGYLQTPLFTFARKRGIWLVILFIATMITAVALKEYEREFEQIPWLVLFIPLILSCGGNSGSQSATLIIRALAVGNITMTDWWRIAWREAAVGLILGTSLGCMSYFLAGSLSYWAYGFFVVPISLLLMVVTGTLLGSLLPLGFMRLGWDPAITSTPFVASMIDITGIVLYFSIVRLFLSDSMTY
ncbi:MAG: magnesium transporter [Planctomycetota bacterium]|nr:magnesium transporter [Planctomycetota bacterium]